MPLPTRRRRGTAPWIRALAAGATGLTLCVTMLSGSGPAGAESTPGVTSNSINIGATVPLTGPAAPGYSEIAPAMNAVFAAVNAHGGSTDARSTTRTWTTVTTPRTQRH